MSNTPDEIKQLSTLALKKIRALCKGNGVDLNAVKLTHVNGDIVQTQTFTHIEIHTEVTQEDKKGRHSVGEIINNPAVLESKINELTAKTLTNQDSRKYLAQLLLDRPDKGFSLHAEYFDIPQLKRDYSFHQACGVCHGHGNQACSRCGGNRKEVCNNCHGRTMVPCQYCQGRGFQQGPDGKQKQCNRCFGQRQISCSICQKTGHIACRQCKGSGTNTCNSCGGAAFFTYITHVVPKIKTLFEIDRTTVPIEAIGIIEQQGAKMVALKHIRASAEQIKRDDGGLAIAYNIAFPFADLEFSVNRQRFKAHLFGYKGKMLKLPNFLDDLLAPFTNLLEQAAQGQGAVTNKIRQASDARLIANALLLSVSMPKKKAMVALKKKFPMGVSNDLIKNSIQLSGKALAKATRTTRYSALSAAMAATGVIDAVYFMTPLRGLLTGALDPYVAMAMDLLLIGAGGYLGNYIVGFLTRRPLRQILEPLMPPAKRNTFKPKAHHNPLFSYIGSAVVLFAVLFAAKALNITMPVWFPF